VAMWTIKKGDQMNGRRRNCYLKESETLNFKRAGFILLGLVGGKESRMGRRGGRGKELSGKKIGQADREEIKVT